MPKRSAEEKIDKLKKKLLKLEKKKQDSLRALETPTRDNYVCTYENDNLNEPPPEEDGLQSPPPEAVMPEELEQDDPTPSAAELEPEQLDPELLTALGETINDDPKFGPNIHANLAERWAPLLRKGLPSDTKEKILKEYPVPENCPLLQAPKLNPEISAAISDLARNRDKKMENSQQQLGLGITALNRGLTTLLKGGDRVSAIQDLSNSSRILSDLHFMETLARTKIITSGLAKSFLTVIQDNERDETLFGKNLSEKIKASKAIEKQGMQLKKPGSGNSVKAAPTAPTQSRHQGNWQNPARYPSNRGGRGGRGRGVSATSRNRNNAQPQSRPAGHSRQRGTTTTAPQ